MSSSGYTTEQGPYEVQVGANETLENIYVEANNSRVNITATGSGWTIRNIGIEGPVANSTNILNVQTDGGNGTIKNVFAENVPNNFVFVDPNHLGHIDVTNCTFIDNLRGNGSMVHASPPGNPNIDWPKATGQGGTVAVEVTHGVDISNYGVLLGSDGSSTFDLSIDKVGVGAANLYGQNTTFENVDLKGTEVGFRLGEPVEENANKIQKIPSSTLTNYTADSAAEINPHNGEESQLSGSVGPVREASPPDNVPGTAQAAAEGTYNGTPRQSSVQSPSTPTSPTAPNQVGVQAGGGGQKHSIDHVDSGVFSDTGKENIGLLDGFGAGLVSDGQGNYTWAFKSLTTPGGTLAGGSGTGGTGAGSEPKESVTEAPLKPGDFEFDTTVDFVEDLGADPSGSDPSDNAVQALNGLSERVEVNIPDGNYRFSATTHDLTGPQSIGFVTDIDRKLPLDAGSDTSGTLGDGGAQGPSFIAPEGFSGDWIEFGGELLWNGVNVDRSASGAGPGFLLGGTKTLVQGNKFLGPDLGGEDGATFTVSNTGKTVFRNMNLSGTKTGASRTGIHIDQNSTGANWLESCKITGYSGGGVIASGMQGSLNVLGGTYENNGVAQIEVPDRNFLIDAPTIRSNQQSEYSGEIYGIKVA